jgi:predicted outer membrane repeat protein
MFRTLWNRLSSKHNGRSDQKRRSRSFRPWFDLLENRLAPAVYTVTNLSDAVVPPSGLDLRQAIHLANDPANAGSTINFAVNGTITLVQGQLDITQPMTITGAGHTVAVSGANRFRDFNITTPGTVTIDHLTIKDGNVQGNGGGINDTSPYSILNLSADQIIFNRASGNGGGVYSEGIVNVSAGTLVDGNHAGGFGGGIYAGRNLTVTSSTITNNDALAGGGIYQNGTGTTVRLINSTVRINRANSGNGGGVWALFNVVGTGGTVSNNTALGGGNGGGIYSQDGNVTLTGTLVNGNVATGQGGGIWADFNVTLTSATVSNNLGNMGGGGVWADDGFVKLFGSTVSGNTAGNGSLGRVINPGDGGGIWSGTDVTMNASSTVTGNTANGNGGGIFARRSVTVNGGTVSNNMAVTTTYDDMGNPTNGNGGGIYALLDVTLNGGLVTGNSADFNGGGIYNDSQGGNIDINSGAVVSNNNAGHDGGGIWNRGGNVSIDSSTITGNQANNNGGGLWMSGDPEENGSLVVTNSTFSLNRAFNEGGGIYVERIEAVTIDGSTFDHNTASMNGGGIASHDVLNLAITNTAFTNNDATSGSGGGLYAVGTSDVYLDTDRFVGNTAGVSGGGIYLRGPGLVGTIFSCFFDNNVSYGGPTSGSALFVDTGALVDLNLSDFDDSLGLSRQLSTDLIDVGGSPVGVIFSSGGNEVVDSSWMNVTNFGFAGSGDRADV